MKLLEIKLNHKVNCCGSIFKNPKNKSAWRLIKSSINEVFIMVK